MSPPRERRNDERIAVVETKIENLQQSVIVLGRTITDHATKAEAGNAAILEELKATEGRLEESISGVKRRHAKLEKRIYFFSALLAGAAGVGTKWGGKIMEIFK